MEASKLCIQTRQYLNQDVDPLHHVSHTIHIQPSAMTDPPRPGVLWRPAAETTGSETETRPPDYTFQYIPLKINLKKMKKYFSTFRLL